MIYSKAAFLAVLMVIFSSMGFASTIFVPNPNGYQSVGGGNYMRMPAGSTIPSSGSLFQAPAPITFQTPTGLQSMGIPQSVSLNVVGLGEFAIPILAKFGAAGKLAALALTVCSSTSLCFNSDGTVSPPKSSNPNSSNCVPFGSLTYLQQEAYKGGSYNACGPDASSPSVAPTPSQLTAAAASLDAAAGSNASPSAVGVQVAQNLSDGGQSVPAQSPVLGSASHVGASSTVTGRDPSGNPITQTVSTPVYNAVPTGPNNVTVTNNTTTTTTNLTNNTTTTVNSSTPVSPAAPPPDPITFDTVQDVQLPTQDISPAFTVTSLGEGTCPADPVVMASGHPITIPLHIVCNAMSTVRPIVILLGVLIAGYIVSGTRKGQSDG
jgi:hypothetical protein